MFSEQPNPKAARHLRALRLQSDPADMLNTLNDILIDRPESRWDVTDLSKIVQELKLLESDLQTNIQNIEAVTGLRYDILVIEHLTQHRYITMRTIQSILARTQGTHPIDKRPYLHQLVETFDIYERMQCMRRVRQFPLPDADTPPGIRQLFAGT